MVFMKNALNGIWAEMAVMGALTFLVAQPRHPHIRAAVGSLQAARQELQEAAHDFCGHRAQALKDTDAALRQLRLAMSIARYPLRRLSTRSARPPSPPHSLPPDAAPP